jgi:hypothetical protein
VAYCNFVHNPDEVKGLAQEPLVLFRELLLGECYCPGHADWLQTYGVAGWLLVNVVQGCLLLAETEDVICFT